jgi:hypothetical protein
MNDGAVQHSFRSRVKHNLMAYGEPIQQQSFIVVDLNADFSFESL